MIKAGIIGATGYAGNELARLLLGHKEVEVAWYGSRSYIDQKYADVYQNFFKLIDAKCMDDNMAALADEVDVIFTATPQGLCASLVNEEILSKAKVVDLSADFRIKDVKKYEKWYGIEHKAPQFIDEAVYGLCEINREDIKKARLIANPGCYPTCSTLSIYPLLKEGLIDPNTIIIDAKSGTSGAGRGAKVANLYCEVNENIKAYGVATHRHTPEIEDQLGYACGQEVLINFTPHLIPMNRGILITAYASLKKEVSYEEVKAVYDKYYENETFVRVLDKDVCPQTKCVEGSNYVDVNFKIDPRTKRVIMMGAMDNLVKGAAGQTVQRIIMKIITGGVTAAKGFQAASTAAGIKYQGRTDMAMVYSEKPCVAAGTFTTNIVKAAPVKWDQDIVYNHPSAQVIICNSGIANACTGEEGFGYCRATAKAAAETLNVDENSVLVASTGVIGMQLPIEKLSAGVKAMAPKLQGTLEAGNNAAKAIMTTDTKEKEVAVEIEVGGKTVTIGGMCKGSGMIHPNMCTMLGFVTTDACISKKLLQEALSEDVKDTYNMVSVDGDTSTNDTVLLLANGMAENPEINEKNEDYQKFCEALNYINTTLAKKIAGDGEGATALFEVKIIGAESKEQAVTLSKSIVTSSLTKAAIYGHDANWGRILCAMGYSGAQFDPEKVDLYFESKAGKIQIIENGVAVNYSEEEATKILSEDAVTAIADVKMGDCTATAWGCDLTYDYIKINADYRS